MRRLLSAVLALAFLVSMSACSGDNGANDDDDGNGNGNGNGTATMSGTIDGEAWTATVVLMARSGNIVGISGRDAAGREIVMELRDVTGAGSVTIGGNSDSTVRLQIGSDAWVGHREGAGGEVVLTTLTDTHVTGTFDVTVVPQTTGATGTRVVEGTFNGDFGQT